MAGEYLGQVSRCIGRTQSGTGRLGGASSLGVSIVKGAQCCFCVRRLSSSAVSFPAFAREEPGMSELCSIDSLIAGGNTPCDGVAGRSYEMAGGGDPFVELELELELVLKLYSAELTQGPPRSAADRKGAVGGEWGAGGVAYARTVLVGIV